MMQHSKGLSVWKDPVPKYPNLFYFTTSRQASIYRAKNTAEQWLKTLLRNDLAFKSSRTNSKVEARGALAKPISKITVNSSVIRPYKTQDIQVSKEVLFFEFSKVANQRQEAGTYMKILSDKSLCSVCQSSSKMPPRLFLSTQVCVCGHSSTSSSLSSWVKNTPLVWTIDWRNTTFVTIKDIKEWQLTSLTEQLTERSALSTDGAFQNSSLESKGPWEESQHHRMFKTDLRSPAMLCQHFFIMHRNIIVVGFYLLWKGQRGDAKNAPEWSELCTWNLPYVQSASNNGSQYPRSRPESRWVKSPRSK